MNFILGVKALAQQMVYYCKVYCIGLDCTKLYLSQKSHLFDSMKAVW